MTLHVFDESRQWGHYDHVGHGHEQRVSQPVVAPGVEFKGDYEVYIPRAPAPPVALTPAQASPALAAAPDEVFGLPRKYVLAAGIGVAALAAFFLIARRRG